MLNKILFNSEIDWGWIVLKNPDWLAPETFSSLLVMGIIIILSFVTFFIFRKADPLKSKGGFTQIIAMFIEKIDSMQLDLMGPKYNGFGGYVAGLALYIGLSFLIGLTGLPAPLTYYGNALSIALCTFIMLHANAVRANGWKYFQRYIDPIPVLLPINLLSMWAPLLSLSLRIFGNALSGFVIMGIIYFALGNVSALIFGGFIKSGLSNIFIAPFITPVLHAYFDLFSGFIQTLIFIMLTMIFISQENPDPSLE